MAHLAIKGHATRGNEVIEILEMLGGNNTTYDLDGSDENAYYYIHHDYIDADHKDMIGEPHPEFKHYTLEKFLEKFPYKVGDKAFAFDNKCTIIDAVWDEGIYEVVYTIKLDTSKYTTTKLSNQLQPYKEETMKETIKIDIPKGYEFAGVDAQQAVFDKVKPKCPYPKNYDECYDYLLAHASFMEAEKIRLSVIALHKVIRCLHTYWAIDGEPDFNDYDNRKYTIINIGGVLMQSDTYDNVRTLTFKSEEACDAFYENFKDLIEQCKELL